ncbi:hypothetical protein D9615_005318 [Tricholomella constricta]|uniref:Prephenate dehydratase domain-containing protein n=1 Tax=Tricholomella constricta TaxID=117010 RepID=A0A8H5H5W1_9AGAR|nr:hypothetical protein D9615_005318 [Tricholomella constricta]
MTDTDAAAHKLFGPDIAYDESDTIQGVFNAVAATVNAGVVPQENTIFGNVIETYDSLREAGPGVKLHEIQSILSHEQALGQCRDFIKAHLPSASLVKTTSTAAAARALLDNPPNCAAIGSRLCASLFGLSILYESIQDDSANFTRFYIVTRDRDIPLPSWLPKNQPRRALIRILTQPSTSIAGPGISQLLAALKTNFKRIDRRPSRGSPTFRDVYFVELQDTNVEFEDGDAWSLESRRAVQRIEGAGGDARLIGIW